MQTILIKKDYLDELDYHKKDYFNAVLSAQNDCVKYFGQRNKEKTIEALNRLFDMSSHAYDLDTLKETTFLQGMICQFFRDYSEALKNFKNAVSKLLS